MPLRPAATTSVSARDVGVPPLPAIQSVTEIGPVGQNPMIYGRDGTFSARVFGVSLWTFGDTPLTVPGASGQNWADNTLSWSTDTDASNGITLNHDFLDSKGVPGEFVPYTPAESTYNYEHDSRHCSAQPCGAEYAFWPGPPIPDRARGRVLITYFKLWRIPGQAGWTNIGSGIVVGWPNGKVNRPILSPGLYDPTLMWDSTQTAFSAAAVVVGDTAFTYGCDGGFLVMKCKVAKVHLADILNESKWQFYAGGGVWAPTQASAVPVFNGGAAGSTVFFVPYLGVYMAVYNGVFSDDIFYRVSATPWGPWSNQALMFTGRPGWNGNIDYAGQAHPEYAQLNGKVQYVTYVHATGFLQSELPLVRVVFK
jgi:hypothetical protein